MVVIRDSTPKINGSEGVFVGIIVALSLIFIIASIGIFILLRYWEPSDRDRDRRRRFSIRRAGAEHTLPIGLPTLTSPFPQATTLREKLDNMFRSGGRRRGSGWHMANDEDWDDADEMVPGADRQRASFGAAAAPKQRTIVEPETDFGPAGHASPMQFSPAATPSARPYDNPFEEAHSAQTPRELHSTHEDVDAHPLGPSSPIDSSGTRFKEDF